MTEHLCDDLINWSWRLPEWSWRTCVLKSHLVGHLLKLLIWRSVVLFALNTTCLKFLNCQPFAIYYSSLWSIHTRRAKLALLGLINPCGSVGLWVPAVFLGEPLVRITCLVVLIFNVCKYPTAIVCLRLLLLKSRTVESSVLCASKLF